MCVGMYMFMLLKDIASQAQSYKIKWNCVRYEIRDILRFKTMWKIRSIITLATIYIELQMNMMGSRLNELLKVKMEHNTILHNSWPGHQELYRNNGMYVICAFDSFMCNTWDR